MDGAVQVESSHGIEWPDNLVLVSVELQIVHRGRSAFLHWMRRTVDPVPIRDDMHCAGIGNKRQAASFADGDAGLDKVLIPHMNSIGGWCIAAD